MSYKRSAGLIGPEKVIKVLIGPNYLLEDWSLRLSGIPEKVKKSNEVMPRLLYINEKFGHDATIILDSGDACWISVGKKGVLVRSHRHSFWAGLLGSLFGPKLYQERNIYQALSVAQALTATFRPVPQIQIGCKDVMLRAFCTAVWQCSSPERVKAVLNDPALLAA